MSTCIYTSIQLESQYEYMYIHLYTTGESIWVHVYTPLYNWRVNMSRCIYTTIQLESQYDYMYIHNHTLYGKIIRRCTEHPESNRKRYGKYRKSDLPFWFDLLDQTHLGTFSAFHITLIVISRPDSTRLWLHQLSYSLFYIIEYVCASVLVSIL